MAVFETWMKNDLKKPVEVMQLTGNLFSADNGGNLIGVEVLDNGSAANLSGTVTGYVIREDNATVTITGTLSGNKASIVLPSSAYSVIGKVSIVIKVGNTTVGACVGYVYQSTTDTLVDPGHVIPSISELLAKIGACETATTNANNAATNANNKATLANTKAELADSKATLANNAATAANAAAGKIDYMVVTIAEGDPTVAPTATLTLVDGHYVLAFNNMKGVQGDTGDAFHIVKTYASISAMNADYSGTDVHVGEYVMIVSTVEDPDNAKVYIKGSEAWSFVVDMSGATGIQGQQAYVWIRYADAQPTQDSDMKTTPSNWIGIYSGTASSAPTSYSSYTWYEFKGATGQPGQDGTSYYVHIRYSEEEPTQDSDMKTTPDAWIGIYSGTSATAPTTYTSYTWYEFKGTKGDPGDDGQDGQDGQDGTSAYVHIRYASAQPTQDSDMKTTADDWIGIYSGSASSAPTTYTSYTWYKIKGETGSAANVYATTVPMSENDSTKVSEAIAAKLSANQGSANAKKFLRVGTSGEVTYDDPYERASSASGFPATGDEHKLYVAMDTGLIYVWDNTGSDYVMVGGSGSGDSNIAAEYAEQTYSKDDLCFHEDTLYRANQDITTAESWTAAHWTATTIAAELLRRKRTQTAVTDPTASGTGIEFISGITQDTEGVIVPSKKSVREASTSQSGLMTATDKKLINSFGGCLTTAETGSTSQAAHGKGTYFLWNNALVEATSDIAIGDTISLSNIAPASDALNKPLQQLDELRDEIGIVIKGNKTLFASGIAVGQFVIVRNSTISGITDGLYKAALAIPYNTVIDSTYLTAVSGGGLNELSDHLAQFQEVKTLLEINSNPPTSATAMPLAENTSHFMFIAVMGAWVDSSSATTFMVIPSAFWEANSGDIMYLRLNNGIDSTSSFQLSYRTTTSVTLKCHNTSDRFRIVGIGRIASN